ncbi:MAG: hypothetical protein M1829_006227 [Trizodia sp. TS-e1964]|nr:MAG: hypothetical protein M1829_006227 [Trizodia sp. TS-e1964]
MTNSTATEQPSTLGSYITSAKGTAQSVLGSLTGSTADQNAGATKQNAAAAENEASHSIAKVGNVNVGPTGAATVDNPNRTQGSWDQTIGSAKEAIGGLVGAEGLRQEGRRQNAEGQGREAEGQGQDYVQGITNRVQGTLGNATSALKGDRVGQLESQEQHDRGKTQQRSVEADVHKQAGY